MSKPLASISILGLALLAGQAQSADTIGGVARADFAANELTIPCVHLQNFDGKNNDMYFDVMLKRRGNSFNFELTLAEPEDTEFCERLADFANYEDDDLEGEDGNPDAPRILVQCEAIEGRSSVSVAARNLEEGDYSVALESGTGSVESDPAASADGKVEFDFDSDADAITAGATELDAAFIQGGEVTASLLADDGETVLEATAVCATQ